MARKTAALCQSRRTAVKRKCSGASPACVPGFGLLLGICMCNAVCAPLSVYNFVGLCNACLCLHMWVRSHSSASVHLVLSDQSLSAVSSVDAFFLHVHVLQCQLHSHPRLASLANLHSFYSLCNEVA